VATPIGNLEDITLRALRVLKSSDLIACEDTRTTQKLCARYDIHAPLVSYFQHSAPTKIDWLVEQLRQGKNISLVSEAGTPCISDPGTILVAAAVKAGIKIVSIPGASGVLAALAMSGWPVDRFAFYGFLPRKHGRQKILAQMLAEDKVVVFYESPHRIVKTMEELAGLKLEGEVVICRELTKKFEETIRGSSGRVLEQLRERKEVRGEIVVIIQNSKFKMQN
jgi:16S rRNA (cytidine1402-2'-O)-methyltransferase